MSDVDKAQQGSPEQRDRSTMSEETPPDRVIPRREGAAGAPGEGRPPAEPAARSRDDRDAIRESPITPNPLLGPTESTRATYHTPQPAGERRREPLRDTTAARTPDEALGYQRGEEE